MLITFFPTFATIFLRIFQAITPNQNFCSRMKRSEPLVDFQKLNCFGSTH